MFSIPFYLFSKNNPVCSGLEKAIEIWLNVWGGYAMDSWEVVIGDRGPAFGFVYLHHWECWFAYIGRPKEESSEQWDWPEVLCQKCVRPQVNEFRLIFTWCIIHTTVEERRNHVHFTCKIFEILKHKAFQYKGCTVVLHAGRGYSIFKCML